MGTSSQLGVGSEGKKLQKQSKERPWHTLINEVVWLLVCSNGPLGLEHAVASFFGLARFARADSLVRSTFICIVVV